MMETIMQDLKFALRQLWRAPGFAVTAVLTLALGIGANTAIFSLLDQALLRSLPVHDPGSLVVLEATGKAWNGTMNSNGGDDEAYFSYPMYRDLQAQTEGRGQTFADLIATSAATVGFARGGRSQIAQAELVSGNYFASLGVPAALGRTLVASDDGQPNANPVAVLSYDFWRDRLGADPSVVGATVTVNGRPFQVIGVATQRFQSAVWGQAPGLFVPMSMIDEVLPGGGKRLTDHSFRWMNIVGRLQSGISRVQAQAAVAPLWHALRADEMSKMGRRSPRFIQNFLTDSRLEVMPGARGLSYRRNGLEKPFLAVMAMALLVLLISVVNVASLLLVRSAGRVREFSLRTALGAQASRIFSQLLLEGVLIGVAGGVLGLLMAPLALRVLVSRLEDPDTIAAFSSSLDLRVLVFNFAVALVVSLGFSLAPAMQLRKPNLVSTLREGASTSSSSLGLLRRTVVCLQIGLSVILLVGAGLFLRTMQKLHAVDVGFNTARLVTFGVDPELAGYTVANSPALHRRLQDALAALPGVAGVTMTDDPELQDNEAYTNVSVSGYVTPPDDNFRVEASTVAENYLPTMGMTLVAGRGFTADDDTKHPPVSVVDESFAKHFCGSAAACLGRHVGNGAGSKVVVDREIVGVVRDSVHSNIRDAVTPTEFRPLRQRPEVTLVQFYVRTLGDPAALLPTVRRTVANVDPSLAIGGLRTMTQQIDTNLQNERLTALLAVAFGALATLLAGVGLYGVLAFATAQRTREIGIRMALGSTRGSVAQLVLADVLKLAALSLLVALPVAWALGHLLQAQLFGVSAADPVVLVSVAGLIALVALISGFLPARRAASIEPVTALRTE